MNNLLAEPLRLDYLTPVEHGTVADIELIRGG